MAVQQEVQALHLVGDRACAGDACTSATAACFVKVHSGMPEGSPQGAQDRLFGMRDDVLPEAQACRGPCTPSEWSRGVTV